MASHSKHRGAFDPATRRYFARLIRKHGILGAVEFSVVRVSVATLAAVAREFNIPLRRGRRPMARSSVAPPQLSDADRERLRQMLDRSAREFGYNSDRWTARRAAELIRRTFEVKCLSCHVERIVKTIGLTVRRGVVDRSPFNSRTGIPRTAARHTVDPDASQRQAEAA